LRVILRGQKEQPSEKGIRQQEPTAMSTASDMENRLQAFRADFDALRHEISKVIVGQDEAIQGLLTALVAGGHVLLEGFPGTGKTVLGRTLATVIDLSFSRIQCTPDLMPADVIGTYVVMETPQGRRTFEFQKGPLFANLVLVDQVNRTMPKTQTALLEAMDEEAITVSTETFRLPDPYFIVATQNPLESEGTYPLPEAQIDRFFFKLVMTPADELQLEQILDRTTEPDEAKLRVVADGRRIREMREVVKLVPIAPEVRHWAVAAVAATHPNHPRAPESVRRLVRHGASPRGAQALVLGAKVHAIVNDRHHVAIEDLRAIARPALGHRLILNFEGQAESAQTDALVDDILQTLGKA
jgi:MoxR-like ATPase